MSWIIGRENEGTEPMGKSVTITTTIEYEGDIDEAGLHRCIRNLQDLAEQQTGKLNAIRNLCGKKNNNTTLAKLVLEIINRPA